MTKREEFQKFLEEIIKPALKENKNNVPGLEQVLVWIEGMNEERGIVKLGLALQQGLGCSPFCGCAAGQLASVIEDYAIQRMDWVTRVIGIASIPKSSGAA